MVQFLVLACEPSATAQRPAFLTAPGAQLVFPFHTLPVAFRKNKRQQAGPEGFPGQNDGRLPAAGGVRRAAQGHATHAWVRRRSCCPEAGPQLLGATAGVKTGGRGRTLRRFTALCRRGVASRCVAGVSGLPATALLRFPPVRALCWDLGGERQEACSSRWTTPRFFSSRALPGVRRDTATCLKTPAVEAGDAGARRPTFKSQLCFLAAV